MGLKWDRQTDRQTDRGQRAEWHDSLHTSEIRMSRGRLISVGDLLYVSWTIMSTRRCIYTQCTRSITFIDPPHHTHRTDFTGWALLNVSTLGPFAFSSVSVLNWLGTCSASLVATRLAMRDWLIDWLTDCEVDCDIIVYNLCSFMQRSSLDHIMPHDTSIHSRSTMIYA